MEQKTSVIMPFKEAITKGKHYNTVLLLFPISTEDPLFTRGDDQLNWDFHGQPR